MRALVTIITKLKQILYAVNAHTYVKSIFHLIRRARMNQDTTSTRNIAFSFAICSYTRMHVRSLMERDVVIW